MGVVGANLWYLFYISFTWLVNLGHVHEITFLVLRILTVISEKTQKIPFRLVQIFSIGGSEFELKIFWPQIESKMIVFVFFGWKFEKIKKIREKIWFFAKIGKLTLAAAAVWSLLITTLLNLIDQSEACLIFLQKMGLKWDIFDLERKFRISRSGRISRD